MRSRRRSGSTEVRRAALPSTGLRGTVPRATVPRVTALLGAVLLALSACSLPGLPGNGPDLESRDVISLTRGMVMPDGYFGETELVITEDTLSERYVLPDGSEIYTIEQQLGAEEREQLEQAAEDYLGWEPSVSAEERNRCMDATVVTVEVIGSLTHESTMQDCDVESPLRDLTLLAEDTLGEAASGLAWPYVDWSVELRPWAGSGPDETAPVESYRLDGDGFGDGMMITPENAPDGWGSSLEPLEDPYAENGQDRVLAPWGPSGDVLSALNTLLLAPEEPTCADPAGELRVLRLPGSGDPEPVVTRPLCPGDPAEDLAAVVREL